MSDPTDSGAKAPPVSKPTAERTGPSTPAPAKEKQPSKSGFVDLTAYRKAQAVETGAAAKPQREYGPRVHFGDLAGLEGFHAKDAFEGVDDDYGPWEAVTIVDPSGKELGVAISNAESGPGRAVKSAIQRGLFDDPNELVSIRVRKQPSKLNPEFTRVLVSFE